MAVTPKLERKSRRTGNLHMETRPLLLLVPLPRDLTEDAFRFEATLRVLPFAQQTRILKKKFQHDQAIALLSALLQSYVLRKVSNQKEVVVEFGEYGKPVVSGWLGAFSMSNERHICGMVVRLDDNTERKEIGLDLSRSRGETLAEFQPVLSLGESAYLETYSVAENNGIESPIQWVWAMKEAYGKYTGHGINYEMEEVEFKWPLRKVNVALDPGEEMEWLNALAYKVEAVWYQTSLTVKGEKSPLKVFLAEMDGVVSCVVGEELEVPLLYKLDGDELVDRMKNV